MAINCTRIIYFYFLNLVDNLHTRASHSHGTVRENLKNPGDFDDETRKLKCGGIHAKVRVILTTVIWKEKQSVCIQTNLHVLVPGGNYVMNAGSSNKITSNNYKQFCCNY